MPRRASIARWLPALLPLLAACGRPGEPGFNPDAPRNALMAVLAAVGLLHTWASGYGADPPREGGPPRPFRWLEVATAMGLGVVAFAWLRGVNQPLAGNGVFITILDCLLFDECFTVGQGSSVLLDNGAVWPEIEMAVRHLGGSVATLQTVVLALLAAGVVPLFLVVSRFARPAAAVPAVAFALALLGSFMFASPLLDTSIPFLFCSAAAACLLVFVLTGRTVALVLAAGFEAHAFNSHVCAVCLLPAFLVVPALAGRSPLRSAGVAGVSYLAASAMTSSYALRSNWEALAGVRLLPWALAGGAGLVAAAVWLAPRFQRLGPTARAAVVAACLLAPWGAGVLLLLRIGHPVRFEYLPPVIAPLAATCALVLGWIGERTLPLRGGRWGSFLLPMGVGLLLLRLNAWSPAPPPRTDWGAVPAAPSPGPGA